MPDNSPVSAPVDPPPAPAAPGSIPLGTWVVHIASDRLLLSPRAQQWFGVDGASQPMPVSAAMARIHADDQPPTISALVAAMTAGQPYETEFRLPLAGGGWRRLRSQGRVVRDDEGMAQFFLGALADISGPHDADAVRAALDAALQDVSPDRIEDIEG